jgi:hypothetical protein
VAMTFIVTLAVFITCTGWIWAAMRRKSRMKRALINLKLADRYVDLDFRQPAGISENSVSAYGSSLACGGEQFHSSGPPPNLRSQSEALLQTPFSP